MPPLRNTPCRYGLVSIALHWLIALALFGLFALGLWMDDLNYYHAWYHRAPHYHKSLGLLVVLAMLIRLVWRYVSPPPAPEPRHARWEVRLARLTHLVLYGLVLTLGISGYLIATAEGKPVALFNWLQLPATLTAERQEDIAGEVHETLAWSLIALAGLHALAALKHHWLDKDRTLLKMLGSDRSRD